MAEVNININISNWNYLIATLMERLKNKNDLLKTAFLVGGFPDIVRHFADEEGEKGKWVPRKPSTQDAYARIAEGLRKPPRGARRGSFSPNNKLLQMTGRLRQSLIAGDAPRSGSIRNKGASAVEFFSNVNYSGVHDRGGKKMPQREFMWLSERAKELMTKIILDKLVGDNGV